MYVLETERLLLLPITNTHENKIHKLHHDPLIVQALFKGLPPSKADTKERVRLYCLDWSRHGMGFFAVYLKQPGGVIGRIVGRSGFRFLSGTREIEFGHCFTGQASGQGLAPEAGHEVTRFGFEILGLKRIVSVVRPENERGLKAIAKLGFRCVGDRLHNGRLMKYFEITPGSAGITCSSYRTPGDTSPVGSRIVATEKLL